MSTAQDLLRGVINLARSLGAPIFNTLRQGLENLSEALDLQAIELRTLRAVNDDLSGQLMARNQTIASLSAENAHLRQTAYHRIFCVECWLSGNECDSAAQCVSCVQTGKACERRR